MNAKFHLNFDGLLNGFLATNIILKITKLVNWPWYIVLWPLELSLIIFTIVIIVFIWYAKERR